MADKSKSHRFRIIPACKEDAAFSIKLNVLFSNKELWDSKGSGQPQSSINLVKEGDTTNIYIYPLIHVYVLQPAQYETGFTARVACNEKRRDRKQFLKVNSKRNPFSMTAINPVLVGATF